MSEDSSDTLEWPDDDPELERAIGRAIIAWGSLEREIDGVIKHLYHLVPELAQSITANLGTKAKIEIFQSGAHCLQSYFTDPEIKAEDIDSLVNDTASTSGKYRNFITHGQPMPVVCKDEKHFWLWIRPFARKGGPKLNAAPLDATYFDEAAKEIKALYDRWSKMLDDMGPGLTLYHTPERLSRGGDHKEDLPDLHIDLSE